MHSDIKTSDKIAEILNKHAIYYTSIPTKEWVQINKTNKASMVTTSVTIIPNTWNHLELIWIIRTVTETLFEVK